MSSDNLLLLLRDTMQRRRVFFLLLLLFNFVGVGALTPCERLATCSDLSSATVGVHIVVVDTREVVASYNAHKSFVPASLVKIPTAVAVMKTYDDDMRWYTSVGYTGHLVDSMLYGDIVIRGSIDPSLSNPSSTQPVTVFIDSLLSAVAQAGIKQVCGRVVVDESICDMGGWSEWMVEDMGYYYGAACFGANYKGNEYGLNFGTDSIGTIPRLLGASMHTPPMRYINQLLSGEKDLSQIYTMPYASDCLLMGTIPAHRNKYTLRCAMPDAPLFMAYDITATLREAGVVVEGTPTTYRILSHEGQPLPSAHTTLYVHASDCLSDMVSVMMHRSNNLYAESLLRYVALSRDSIATISQALSVERTILSQVGVDTLCMKISDGCGLSRKNLMTPHSLATLLLGAYNDAELGTRFVSRFPQAGKEGSVKSMMARKPLPGLLRLKSGSMSGVLCYAGYYEHGGRNYAIVLMSNNHSCKTSVVRAAFERLLRDLFANR